MFGANCFGQPTFGQGFGGLTNVVLSATTVIVSFTTVSGLTVEQTLAAQATVTLGVDATLNVSGPLVGDTGVAVATSAQLSGATSLGAVAGLQVSAFGDRPLMAADLAAASTVMLSAASPNLSPGGVPLAADAALALGTFAGLRGLSADLAADATVSFAASGDIRTSGKSLTTVVITFNGVEQSANRISKTSLAITDALNESPNTCDFTVYGTPPAIDTDVKIGLLNVLPGNLLFAGVVQRVTKAYQAKPANVAWAVSCVDYTDVLNRRLVYGAYTNVSATTVAQDVVARFAPGFSPGGIVSGLPAITITLNGVPVMQAIVQIAAAIGGYADVDLSKVVQLFITPSAGNPPHVVDGSTASALQLLPELKYDQDGQPVRDKIMVTGGAMSVGGSPDFSIPPGATVLPVQDATIASTGQVITEDAQILTYTSVAPGGIATTVSGAFPGPSTAPLASIAAGTAGGLIGTYRWAVAFANSAGETVPGPSTLALNTTSVANPPNGPGIGNPSNNPIGPLVGAYMYAVSFITSLGETLVGPSVSRTTFALAAPAAPTVGDSSALPGPLVPGARYGYAVSFVTPYGETPPSALATYTPSAPPGAGFSAPTPVTFGGLTVNANYYYGISIVTAIGESSPPLQGSSANMGYTAAPTFGMSFISVDSAGRIAPGTYQYALTFYSDAYGETPLNVLSSWANNGTLPCRFQWLILLPNNTFPDRCDGLRVYRALVGGNPFQLNWDVRRGGSMQYYDVLSQAECGNPHPIHPLRAGVSTSIFLNPSSAPGVLARRLYRCRANASELYLVAEVQNNVGATVIDSAFDSALTARNPVVQTSGRAATVILPTSSRPGVTARKIYRTQANGSIPLLLATIQDNVTTSFVDVVPDSALTDPGAPGTSAGVGEQHQLSSIPIGPAGILARRVYRTRSGGSEFKLLTQLSDNATSTFIDAVPDVDLGAGAPLSNSAGAAAALLSNIPIGPAGISQRVIYRTAAGGSDFKYAGTINDNAATTFIDTAADGSLGRLPQATSTIGANAGDTSLQLSTTAGFPAPGWIIADSQIITYAAISGNAVVGIPPLTAVASITRSGQVATLTTTGPHGFTTGQRIVVIGATQPDYNGTQTITVLGATVVTYPVTGTPFSPAGGTIKVSAAGALIGAIAGGTTIKTLPMLKGVSNIVRPIRPGSAVRLYVVRGTGGHEFPVDDSELLSVAACAARGDAELLLNQVPRITVTYDSRDVRSRSGQTVTLALGPPTNVSGSLLIQSVRITEIDIAPRTFPRFSVTASNARYSLADLLRHVVLDSH